MSEITEALRNEEDGLLNKIRKLEHFIAENETFKKLPYSVQYFMRMQLAAMRNYDYYLRQRITYLEACEKTSYQE